MALHNPITSTIRNTKRVAQIVTVLGKHGFSEVIEQLGLPGLIDKGLGLVGYGPDEEHVKLPQHVRLRMVLEELGPTYIKMGQVLSTRPDLIAPELAEEFASLQSDCPKMPFEAIRERLVQEFGEEKLDTLFASIDETPLAAASMAQVHPAVLADGTEIVLKVLRPGIRKTIESDMEVLGELARFAEDYFAERGYSPKQVVAEFAGELQKELDFEHEARATRRLHRLFADDPNVNFPKVYSEASTKTVLCLERVHGRLLSRIAPEDMDDATRRAVVENGADAVFRMCLRYGFFHADPHPGNLFVLDGGRLCFIDCGMTGHIEQRTAEALAELLQAVIDGELDRTIRSVLTLADAEPSLAMDRSFRLDVWAYISRFQVDHLSEIELGPLLGEFFVLLRKWKVRCPADLVFLIKAISTIHGVGARIDPDFDLVGHVRPHIVRLIKRRYSVRAAKKRLLGSMRGYIDLAEDLPDEVRAVVAHLKRKDFTVSLEHKGLDRLTSTIEHASRNLALALILASMLLSSAIFFAADNEQSSFGYLSVIGLISLLGCTGFGLFTLYAVYRKRK